MKNNNQTLLQSALLFLAFLILISVVYSPVLYFDFLFHDDGAFWIKIKDYGFRQYYYYKSISDGRFGDAWLLNLEKQFVYHASNLRILRFLAMMISSATACLLFKQLRRLSTPKILAFLIIPPIFFLPGFSDIFFNGSYACIFSICIFLASWSYAQTETDKKIILPVLTFLTAITIYPPAAMFYWTMLGINILFNKDKNTPLFKNNILRSITVGLISLLGYAIILFGTHFFFAHKIEDSLYNPYAISLDFGGKLKWFIHEPLGNALNLWNIFPNITISIFIAGFFILTSLIFIFRKPATNRFHWSLPVFILTFILSFLPNLAAQGNAAFYRCLIPLSSLIWLSLVWSILKWKEIIPKIISGPIVIALLSAIVLIAGVLTNQIVLNYRALPSHVEFNAYKRMADDIRFKKVDAIHIMLPFHNSLERYDEFSVISSHYLFDIHHLIHCAFNEVGGRELPFPIVYITFPGNEKTYQLQEIYFKKLPHDKWVFKDINTNDPYQEYNHAGRNTLDSGMTTMITALKTFPNKQNWYTLDLNTTFNPANYNQLISKTNLFNKMTITIDTKYADPFFNLGLNYYRQGNLNLAISNFNKAIELNPNDLESYNDLAIIYYKLAKYDLAWENVKKIQSSGTSVNPALISALNSVPSLRPTGSVRLEDRGTK